jgi:hypothetical protein
VRNWFEPSLGSNPAIELATERQNAVPVLNELLRDEDAGVRELADVLLHSPDHPEP